jgi:hypothetical protein
MMLQTEEVLWVRKSKVARQMASLATNYRRARWTR